MSIKVSSGQTIKDVKLLEVDNIRIDNNTISTTNVNGDLILDPNGYGNVIINSELLKFDSSYNVLIKSSSVGSGLEIQGPTPNDPWSTSFESPGSADNGLMPTPWILSLRKPSYDDANSLILSPVVTKYDVENLKFKQIKIDNVQIDNNTINTTNGNLIINTNTLVIGSNVQSNSFIQFGLNVSHSTLIRDGLFDGITIERTDTSSTPKSTTFFEDDLQTSWVLSLKKPSYDDPSNSFILSPVVTKHDVENLKFKQIKIDNVQIDNNTISSSNTNGDIILDPNGYGNVRINSGNLVLDSNSKIIVGNSVLSVEDTLSENIKSTVGVGALSAGNTLSSGSNLTTILKALLLKVFYPTISQPSGSISSAAVYSGTATGATSSKVEIGTNTRVLLTGSFTQGQILGKNNASGVWESGTLQNYTDGGLNYYILNGVNTGSTSTNTTSNVTIVSSNTWTGTMYYKAGPQPTDSTGANFSTPLAAGNTATYTSSAISGVRAYFYGASSSINTAPSTSNDIRNNYTANVGWSSPSNGRTQAVSVPAGTTIVVFAYPSSLQDLTSVIDSGTGYNIVTSFGQYSSPGVLTSTSPNTFGVNGASGYVSDTYKVYSYIPSGPIANSSTYTFTI